MHCRWFRCLSACTGCELVSTIHGGGPIVKLNWFAWCQDCTSNDRGPAHGVACQSSVALRLATSWLGGLYQPVPREMAGSGPPGRYEVGQSPLGIVSGDKTVDRVARTLNRHRRAPTRRPVTTAGWNERSTVVARHRPDAVDLPADVIPFAAKSLLQ
jgi:hypothetical protein